MNIKGMNTNSGTVVKIAMNELGYIEKASNSSLDDKTANPGSGNYTKYARDLGHANGYAWCLTFVNWCFMKAYGKDVANTLLCGGLSSASTMMVKDCFNKKGLLISWNEIRPGDIVWRSRNGGGHVELVIGVNGDGSFSTVGGNTNSDGSWNGGQVYQHDNQTSGNWNWVGHPNYSTVSGNTVTGYKGGAVSNFLSNAISGIGDFFGDLFDPEDGIFVPNITRKNVSKKYTIEYEEVTKEITRDEIKTADVDLVRTKSTNLLSYPTLVESPFIILKVGEYSFGTYSTSDARLTLQANGSYKNLAHVGDYEVQYPNYIESMHVVKINGTVNQYTIKLTYQVEANSNPNFVDEIFSKVGYGGKVYISYGDWSAANFIYKEEEAMITGMTSQVDFSGSKITYTVTCTSNAFKLAASTFNFEARTAKPSSVIKEMLQNNNYGLLDVFPGMKNYLDNPAKASKIILESDDLEVELLAKKSTDPLSYINYLVSCMCNVLDDVKNPIRKYSYYLTIHDDTYSDLQGSYFTITKVCSEGTTLSQGDVYEVDIGYPDVYANGQEPTGNDYSRRNSGNLVTSFIVNDDQSWSLLYNYSQEVEKNDYIYSIDDTGKVITRFSPSITTSLQSMRTTEAQKEWWTSMTLFPVSATLTIKGLVRPAMLMTYIRVNALFYGLRHISSGLYFIKQQEDQVDRNGYKTKLTLQRFAGDSDWIETVTTTVTTKIPKKVNVEVNTTILNDSDDIDALFDNAMNQANQQNLLSTGYCSDGVLANGTSGSTNVTDNRQLWTLLNNAIKNPFGTAGLMGNLECESGLQFNRVENAAIKASTVQSNSYDRNFNFKYDSGSYTAAVDKGMKLRLAGSDALNGVPTFGTISRYEFTHMPWKTSKKKGDGTYWGLNGYGLCQWTTAGRKGKLYDLCLSRGVSISDAKAQCDYLIQELLTDYPGVFNTLKTAKSVREASDAVLINFESPAEKDQESTQKYRASKGEEYYRKYAGSSMHI